MSRKEKATFVFKNGYNCAQAVFSSFADVLDLSEDQACRIATGFGGGVARHGEICGAVSGGVLALSTKFGRGVNDPKENMEDVYSKTQELVKEFEKRMGTVNCKKLLNECNLLTPEGQQEFIENGYGSTVCILCVETVMDILEETMTGE